MYRARNEPYRTQNEPYRSQSEPHRLKRTKLKRAADVVARFRICNKSKDFEILKTKTKTIKLRKVTLF